MLLSCNIREAGNVHRVTLRNLKGLWWSRYAITGQQGRKTYRSDGVDAAGLGEVEVRRPINVDSTLVTKA